MIKKLLVFTVLLYPGIVFADAFFSQTITDGCDTNLLHAINNKTRMEPVFEPLEYTCNNGTFLPANTTGCQTCPDSYTCISGTYSFNEKNAQGITAKEILNQDTLKICSKNLLHAINNKTRLTPAFEPIQIHCLTGYYLAANAIECTTCPANSYCVGGTFPFNENSDQGATPCPNNQTSLAGSSSVDQCKTITLNYYVENKSYATTSCTINGLVNLPPDPVREGYTFKGWTLQTNNE